ncbi:MAG: SDR family NAD(P)-dependent oxidoreductase [Myxococcales bacterium]|nr:SDR family NAD(P)-dependent oxidoreductase [Myxococcales bacterium]
MNQKVVMVTGGAGFVGSHLVELLLTQGYEVHVFDRVALSETRNLDAIKDHKDLHYVQGDMRDASALRAFFRPEASILFHLASIVGVPHYMEDPLSLIDIAVWGTRTLLDLAREHGTRFLFASTSEVYGKNPAVPWSEEDDRVLGPTSVDRWSYSTSKALCEHMLFAVARQSGLPVTIVRFFNAYGPRQKPIYVVSRSVYRALRGESPWLFDDGMQTRCFSYIEDVVQGVFLAATHPQAVGEIFNLGRPVESTMREVIEEVIALSESSVSWEFVETQRIFGEHFEEIERRVPSVEKAERILGWKAQTSLREGLEKTIRWARQHPWYLES